MEELFQGRKYVKSYRRMGMIGAIELHEISGQERVGRKIAALALEKGVLIRPIGNIVYFMPPYIITKEEIDSMLEVCKVSIEEYIDRKSTRLNSSHANISYAVFCLNKNITNTV